MEVDKSYLMEDVMASIRISLLNHEIRKRSKQSGKEDVGNILIKDENDFTKHVEYIHYNPVKHGLIRVLIDWEFFSFRRYVRDGIYDREWGQVGILHLLNQL